ncbi:hypothetical protein, partial [Lactobacillus amylovorus]
SDCNPVGHAGLTKVTVLSISSLPDRQESQGVRLEAPIKIKKKWAGRLGLMFKLMSYCILES